MSQTHPLHFAALSRPQEVWHRVDAGIYRGTRAGRPLGEIHTVVGGCVAVDPSGTPVGRYATRYDARRALRAVVRDRSATARTEPRPDHPGRVLIGRTTATILGGVALAGALTAAAAAPWL